MKCELVDRRIGAYLDGELDPVSMLEVERHVEACSRCQELLVFEERFRGMLQDSLDGVELPVDLKAHILSSIDSSDRRAARGSLGVRAAQVFVIAASFTFIVGLGLQRSSSPEPLAFNDSGAAPPPSLVLDEVVRIHSSALPADVRAQAPAEISHYFRDKVSFPVQPAVFDDGEVRLMGARLHPVGARTAAVLYYEVEGRRVTVVVTDRDLPEPGGRLREGEVAYRDVGGYTLPVVKVGRLTYIFTGDVERETLLRLARNARLAR